MRSVPPVSSVRLSGKNAADHTGSPGPTSVRASLRSRRSMIATEPRMPAAAIKRAVARHRDGDDRRLAAFDLAALLAGRREEEHPAVGAAGDDLAVAGDRDRIERRRQRDDGRRRRRRAARCAASGRRPR